MRGSKNIVITGTHGKTTTTALVVHLLRSAGFDPGFLIGGIARDLGTGGNAGDGRFFVIEGDEYDSAFFDKRSKFVHYQPDVLVINNIEFDHADIFADLDAIKRSFRQVVSLVPDSGTVIVNGDDRNAFEVADPVYSSLLRFGTGTDMDVRYRVVKPGVPLQIEYDGAGFEVGAVWGEHNAANAAAALSAARAVGVDLSSVRQGLAGFKGVVRRLEKVAQWMNGTLIYQDFAHHPTAIRKAIAAIREGFPGKRLIVALEPRSNTMVRNIHQEELSNALAEADVLFLGQLHRLEKIPPAERLDRNRLLKDLAGKGVRIMPETGAEEIAERLRRDCNGDEVVLVLSNGAFGGLTGLLGRG